MQMYAYASKCKQILANENVRKRKQKQANVNSSKSKQMQANLSKCKQMQAHSNKSEQFGGNLNKSKQVCKFNQMQSNSNPAPGVRELSN